MDTYEKKYKEALEWARKVMQGKIGFVLDEVLEKFPELKESEGEQHRKWILEYLYDGLRKSDEQFKDHFKCAIAWLEKQGKHANFRNKIQIGDKVTRNEDGVLVNLSQLKRVAKKQDEQKPVENSAKVSESSTEEKDMGEYKKGFECGKQRVLKYPEDFGLCKKSAWSEEDEKQARQIERIVHNDGCTQKLQKQIADWLKSIKERVACEVNCTTTKEWSAVDKVMLGEIIDFFENGTVKLQHDLSLYASWLKSLRPHNRWKPSDEQLEALESATENCAYSEYQDCLRELIRQLKKLKG